ncbi:MAG: hypothetical protein ACPGUV_05025, partial [Polyangiales bacterium]
GGFPVTVYGHGTGGSFTGVVRSGIVRELALGIAGDGAGGVQTAVLSFDLPQHGARRAGSTVPPDQLFFNFLNPPAAAGNVLQGAADFLSLLRALPNVATAADTLLTGQSVALASGSGGKVAWFTHSQGSTHAALMLPYLRAGEGTVAAVLSGLGGDLSQSLLHKRQPIDIATALPLVLLDADGNGALPGGTFHPVLALFQTYFDRADAVNYAWRVQRERVAGSLPAHVLQTYGLDDSYSPEETMQAFARAADLAQALPVRRDFGRPTAAVPLSSNVSLGGQDYSIALRQYDAIDGEGHFVATTAGVPGRAQAVRFVRQALAAMAPVVSD